MKNGAPPTKGKEEGRIRAHSGLIISFWVRLKAKKQHTSYGKAAKYPSRTTRTLLGHAEMQSGPKAHLELKLSKDVKNNKVHEQMHREDIGSLLNRAGKLVTNKGGARKLQAH